MSYTLNAVQSLINAWNSNQIRYCHWKSNEHLREGLCGETDLDILVDTEDRDGAERLLAECGYVQLVPQFGSRYPEVFDWINCDAATGKMIHIHLHYRLATGHRGMKEYSLPWLKRCLETRKFDDTYEIFVCEPNLELVFLYTRIGLKANYAKQIKAKRGKYRLGKDEQREILYLKALTDWDTVREIVLPIYGEDTDALLHIMMADEFGSKELLTLIAITMKRLSPYRSVAGLKCVVQRLYYSFVIPARIKLRRKFNAELIVRKTFGKNYGRAIAFMGQDGAGKTTVTGEVMKWLDWKVDVHKYYMGSGDNHNSVYKQIAAVCGRGASPVAKVLRGLFLVLDLKKLAKQNYNKVLRAKKYMVQGGIVIYDRYPQEQFAGINDGPKIRDRFLKKIRVPILRQYIEHCAKVEEKYIALTVQNSPDLLIKLVLDPEESIRRKPQEKLENVRQKHDIILALKYPHSKEIVIDAAQDYEQEIRLIHNNIWNLIADRTYNE